MSTTSDTQSTASSTVPAGAEKSSTKRKSKQHWQRFLHGYYIVNTLSVLSYIICREYMDTSNLEKMDFLGLTRETQFMLVFTTSMTAQYFRAPSMEAFLDKLFLWSKCIILVSTYVCGYKPFAWYLLLFIVILVSLPAPDYDGPGNVVNMRAAEFTQTVEEGDKDVFWVVEFYTSWAYHCRQFAPVFASLSLEYTTPRLQFAQINVGKYEEIARRYNINIEPTGNKELPTLILFHKGKPVPDCRIPHKTSEGKVSPIVLSEVNVANFLDLDQLREDSLKTQTKAPETGNLRRRK